MKILWCSIDRAKRISNFFQHFRAEARRQLPETTIVQRRTRGMLQSDYNRLINTGDIKPELVVESFLEADNYDLIMIDSFTPYSLEPWKEIDIPKVVLLTDTHDRPKQIEKILESGIEVIIHTYRDSFLQEYGYIYDERTCIWLPLAVNTRMFHKYNVDKAYSVLLTGIEYPMRDLVDMTLRNFHHYKKITRPLDIDKIQHPKKEHYARLLNTAHISVTCGGDYQYPVEKYYEIPACHTLLYGAWIPELNSLGFMDGVNMVSIDVTRIEDQIEYLLDNPDRLRQITENGANLVHSYHNMETRAQQFANFLCDYLGRPHMFNIENDFYKEFYDEDFVAD